MNVLIYGKEEIYESPKSPHVPAKISHLRFLMSFHYKFYKYFRERERELDILSRPIDLIKRI